MHACHRNPQKKGVRGVDPEVTKEDLTVADDTKEDSVERILLDSQDSTGETSRHLAADWDSWTSVTLFLQMCCVTIPLSQAGIPLLASIMDIQIDNLNNTQISSAAVFVEVIQVLIVLGLLKVGTGRDVSSKSFQYHWKPLALWQGAVTGLTAIGCVGAVLLVLEAAGVSTESIAKPVGKTLLESADATSIFNESVLAIILAPFLEELIFRGFLLPSMLKGMTVESAVATSSGLFALWHCSPENILLLFASGCSYGMGYCWSGGNLVVPTLGHMLYNLFVVVGTLTACVQCAPKLACSQRSSMNPCRLPSYKLLSPQIVMIRTIKRVKKESTVVHHNRAASCQLHVEK